MGGLKGRLSGSSECLEGRGNCRKEKTEKQSRKGVQKWGDSGELTCGVPKQKRCPEVEGQWGAHILKQTQVSLVEGGMGILLSF